jgi:DtxR family transcriptional regulator, Mn-dependent transcriptional regulator
MRTEADENYLKEIYILELDHGPVTTSRLAEQLGFSAPTITGMLKKLAKFQWVIYEPYQGVTLTHAGRAIALEVIRHHRLIETYLAQALNIPSDKVHEEAEKLEHVLSEYLEDRMDELLGHPSFDPHGSPIPSHDLSIQDSARPCLADLHIGAIAEIVEINDDDPQLLAYLAELDLHPRTHLQVIDKKSYDGLVTIRAAGKTHILGQASATQITVRLLSTGNN